MKNYVAPAEELASWNCIDQLQFSLKNVDELLRRLVLYCLPVYAACIVAYPNLLYFLR